MVVNCDNYKIKCEQKIEDEEFRAPGIYEWKEIKEKINV
jgi:hypothetical protein